MRSLAYLNVVASAASTTLRPDRVVNSSPAVVCACVNAASAGITVEHDD